MKRQSFLDFVNENKLFKMNKINLFESFNKKDMDSILDMIEKILKKHIDGLIPLVGYVDTEIDGKKYLSKQYIVSDKDDYTKSSLFQFNWLLEEDSIDVYSIDFFKDLDVYWAGTGNSDLTIYTLGTSIVRFLPIIWEVVNTGNYSLSQENAEKLSSKIFKNVEESFFNINDSFRYTIYENLKDSIIYDIFCLENEASDYKRQKLDQMKRAKEDGVSDSILSKMKEEYESICKALDSGASVEDVKMSIKKGVPVKVNFDSTVTDAEKELENSDKKDPEQVFKEMSKYIKLVIKGLQPSLILCGAPGVGKTYRVKKELKAAGYKEGVNMNTIKGKCTTRRLYLALYEMKDEGDITLIDDADSLVGPKADENSINILKAALDSTEDAEGRLVTYGVAGKLIDDDGNEVPKKFYYNGGTIVITNYQAGSLDTALRGRSFIQDIKFTTEDVLNIVKKLMPNISPEIYSAKSKLKAFDYLEELNKEGSDMELSIRTFVLCTKIFEATNNDPDFNDEDAKSMIKEQMKLQYSRNRSKY